MSQKDEDDRGAEQKPAASPKTDQDEDEKAENSDQNEINDEKEETKKPLEKEKKAGVIYLSRIPTKMNVKLIREYMSQFGKVGRIYLEPKEKKRKNEPRSFKEGWVEFEKRRLARECAAKLNNMQVGGKRRNPWYYELWNIKYLKNFRWTHLNERIAYEQEIRKQKLRQDIALAKKESNFYIQNFDKNERRKRVEKKTTTSTKDAEESNANNNNNKNKRSSDDEKEEETGNSRLNKFGKNNHQHPVFERKTKVTGNDDFLKQIFS